MGLMAYGNPPTAGSDRILYWTDGHWGAICPQRELYFPQADAIR